MPGPYDACSLKLPQQCFDEEIKNIILIQSLRTNGYGQTVQTHDQSSLISVLTVCLTICIFWRHYFLVESFTLSSREFPAKLLDIRIFRYFTASLNYQRIPLPKITPYLKGYNVQWF